MTFLRFRFHGRSRISGGDAGGDSIDSLFRHERERLFSVDPATGDQWSRMAARLESERPAMTAVRVRGPLFRPAIAIASIAAAVFLMVMILHRSPERFRYTTGRGQQSSVVLADSTEIMLNHTSSLVVERQGPAGPRSVMLDGEAYFRVKRNGTPFVVSTRLGSVRVVGTEFNVRVREDEIIVGVVKGIVQVSVTRNAVDSVVAVHGGEIVSCTGSGFPGSSAPIPFSGYPGWMHGRFLFYRTTLAAACREIESQFNVNINIETSRLRARTITGAVDGKDAESALTTLAALTGTSFRNEKGTYILR